MRFEMICTGEEVLSGQIVDTNAAWVAQALMAEGIEIQRRETIGDRISDLVSAFHRATETADIVLVNGGLGPTLDDLSAEAMAAAMEVELELHHGWLETMTALFAERGRVMNDKNRKQAMLPQGAIMVDNPIGTACGFRVKLRDTWFFFTPGVPSELKKMFREQLLPWMATEFNLVRPTALHRFLTIGQGESSLAHKLEPLELLKGVSLGFRASLPYIEVKLLQRDELDANQWHELLSQFRSTLGDALIGENVATLPLRVHQLMLERGSTLATAESCTGGMVASQLVDHPGSSAYLLGGLVTYCNESKQSLLNVNPDTLKYHGAVSMETAAEMAIGAKAQFDSDLAVSISGIAGPEGGTAAKPVGTIALALASNEGCLAQLIHVGLRDRNAIRTLAATVAHDMVRRYLQQQPIIADYGYLKRLDTKRFTLGG